ncbi:MAG TPA: AMP-binding protein, partial [Woeseiaceae bacterium]
MQKIYKVPADLAKRAFIDADRYETLYRQSVEDNAGFWAGQASRIDWIRPFTKVRDVSFARDDLHIRWFYDGTLNVCYNCVDRHLEERADDVAIVWESDDPAHDLTLTYRELHARVCRFANALKKLGAKKGDRITIYMPMIPDTAVAMLACARIGAIHSVVFGGFSPDALAGRIEDCASTIVVTADEGVRGGKVIPLKNNVDVAASRPGVRSLQKVLVVRHTGGAIDWNPARDVWLHELESAVDADCPCEEMGAEDPLFILDTSGSTGKPKGVLHTTGGYLVYVSMTHQYVFDYRPGEIFWCTADVGWVTGHSYIVYGP